MSRVPNSALGASLPPEAAGTGGCNTTAAALIAAGDPASLQPMHLQSSDPPEIITFPSSGGGGAIDSHPSPTNIRSSGAILEGALQPNALNPGQSLAATSEVTSSRAAQATAPCGACKFLRRKCTGTCVFAAYFQPDQSPRFANVHKIFGASNVAKWLQELPPQSRDDAVNSLCYEADARIKDPVYGCVGALFALQQQVVRLQAESAAAQSELARLRALAAGQASSAGVSFPPGDISSRLPPPGQLAMVPSFVPASLPPPASMLAMGTFSSYDSSTVQPGMVPMYGTQLKPGTGLVGAAMLPSGGQSSQMPVFSMSAVAHSFSTPTMGSQGLTSTPSSLKLSPQNPASLYGVPSSCSTNELGPTSHLESPLQGSGGSTKSHKRHRSEPGHSSSLADISPPVCNRPQSFAENQLVQAPQRFPSTSPALPPQELNFSKHAIPQLDMDPTQFLVMQQFPERSMAASSTGLRQ